MIRPDLARAIEDLAAARSAFVVATVVRAAKPTSARPGDAAIIHPDGRIDGFVGGACATSTVRLHALQVLESEEPLLLRIQPGGDAAPVDAGATTVSNPCLSGGSIEIFLEPRLPAPLVRVVGDSPVAEALRVLAAPLGFAVAADGRPATGDAAVVIASLGHGDEDAVEEALASGAAYVGLVASPRRGAGVVAALQKSGLCETRLGRLHTPAGLDIGARTHGEIALSILAEIVQLRAAAHDAGRSGLATAPTGIVDPVCGMVEPAEDAWEHVRHGGETLAFCCPGCRRRFEAEPARYLAARPA